MSTLSSFDIHVHGIRHGHYALLINPPRLPTYHSSASSAF